jgi:hypothetical protein
MRVAQAARVRPVKALRVAIHQIHPTLAAQAEAAHQRLAFNQMVARARHLQLLAQALIMRVVVVVTAAVKAWAMVLIKAAVAIIRLRVIQAL